VNQPNYIYLHGFASSPYSTKAKYLRDRFWEHQIPLTIPDLNQGDFSHLTLTRQVRQVAEIFSHSETSVTLIGSSLGGLTAAHLAQNYSQVRCLVLLAPAFNFVSLWLSALGDTQVKQWQKSGFLPVYHYGEMRSLPLHYQFIVDASQYLESKLQKPVPTLILHGRNDDVIPIQASRDYASQRSWVTLIELNSDHSLADVLPEIWQATQQFCQV
jgi:uncharacterized protein